MKYLANAVAEVGFIVAHMENGGRNGMVQAAIKPQPGRNLPDFNSVRTAQKVVEACEVGVGSWP
jgi:hypothetical protein